MKIPLLWPCAFQSRYSFNPSNGAAQHKSRSAHVTGQITTPVWSTFSVYPGNLVNFHFLGRPFRNPASSPCLLGSRSRWSVLGRGMSRHLPIVFTTRFLSILCFFKSIAYAHPIWKLCGLFWKIYCVIFGVQGQYNSAPFWHGWLN